MEAMKPYLAGIFMQFIQAGMFLASKAAFNHGMSSYVFIFYRQLAGTVPLVILAFIFERKSAQPMSFLTFCKIFVLSLIGLTLTSNVSAVALVYTSSTLAAAIINSLPVMTFLLAVLCRMERLKLGTGPGAAKIFGLGLCIAGVVTFSFYKGPTLRALVHDYHHYPLQRSFDSHGHENLGGKWIKGCFLMFVSTISWAWWLIFQVRIMEEYPSKLVFMSLQCFLSAAQTVVVAVAVERDPSQWKLGWNVRLAAIAYSAIVSSGIGYYLQAWVLQKKGPVFQAMWTPLSFLITTFCSPFLLGETIYLGSVLGGILLVGSLYSVLWGKSSEEKLRKSTSQKQISPKDEVNEECPRTKQGDTIESDTTTPLPV